MYKALFFILLYSNSLIGQKYIESKIYWDLKKPLEISDFKGLKSTGFSGRISTSLEIERIKLNFFNGKSTYHAKAVAYPILSYIVPGSESKEILEHEQFHFDITEAFARKLNKEFAIKKINYINAKLLYEKWVEKLAEAQKKYDLETNHGLNLDKQNEWQVQIEKELNYMPKSLK